MKNWQFALLVVLLVGILVTMSEGLFRANRRLQYIQEVLEEQWTIMDSDAYDRIDRYKDLPPEEQEGEKF